MLDYLTVRAQSELFAWSFFSFTSLEPAKLIQDISDNTIKVAPSQFFPDCRNTLHKKTTRMVKHVLTFALVCPLSWGYAQTDSLAAKRLPLKISHAEPVYTDLIRDLGARKGEKEINVGWEMNDHSRYIEHSGFVEYEFSPLNRLGLEVEVPFNYYNAERIHTGEELPNEKIEGLKFAVQYTFLVSGKHRMSMAAGTIYELGLHSFKTISASRKIMKGNELNPFLIVAKRWGRQFHSLLYTGPVFHRHFEERRSLATLQTNVSVHYQLPHSAHLLGVEVNHEWAPESVETVIRPQLKLKLNAGFALGVATGIPVDHRQEGLSFMARLIYELKSN